MNNSNNFVSQDLIGRYCVCLSKMGSIYMWGCFKIGHYRNLSTFTPDYKIALNPVKPFQRYMQREDFYTRDISDNFYESRFSPVNVHSAQPLEWGPFILFDSNDKDAAVQFAKSLNNQRFKLGIIGTTYTYNESEKKILTEIGVNF